MKAIVTYPVENKTKSIIGCFDKPDVVLIKKEFEFDETQIDFFSAGYYKACEDSRFNRFKMIRVQVL